MYIYIYFLIKLIECIVCISLHKYELRVLRRPSHDIINILIARGK